MLSISEPLLLQFFSSPMRQSTHKAHVEFLPSPSVTSMQCSHGALVTCTVQIRPLQTPHSPFYEGTAALPLTQVQIFLGQACHLSRLLFAAFRATEVSRGKALGLLTHSPSPSNAPPTSQTDKLTLQCAAQMTFSGKPSLISPTPPHCPSRPSSLSPLFPQHIPRF